MLVWSVRLTVPPAPITKCSTLVTVLAVKLTLAVGGLINRVSSPKPPSITSLSLSAVPAKI